MDTAKNYIGKVIKVQYKGGGQALSSVGIVYNQEGQGGDTKLSMVLTNGAEWSCRPGTLRETKISSVRIDKDLRTALEKVCDAKIKQKAFLDRFWKEKTRHEDAVESSLKALKEHSGELTRREFMEEVERLFREKYPATGSWCRRYFSWDSVSDKTFSVRQSQDVEKYANPENYSFIYREYDNTLHINSSVKGYKEFCERNAPPILPELKSAKTSVSSSVGDKWLQVHRSYEFPLKDGFTKKSLQAVSELLYPSRKPPLAARISDANARSSLAETSAQARSNNDDKQR